MEENALSPSGLYLCRHGMYDILIIQLFLVAAQLMLAMALFPSQACSSVQSLASTCSPLLCAPLMAKSVC